MMLHGYMHLPAATSQILTSLSTLALASIFLFEKKKMQKEDKEL
jgi:hypothetical protein